MPGETPNSSQPPVKLCNSQGSQLCDQRTCFACEGIWEQKAGIVRGTILASKNCVNVHVLILRK
jgi:hypothetical protein